MTKTRAFQQKDFDISTLAGLKSAERFKAMLNNTHNSVQVVTTGWEKVRIIGRNPISAAMKEVGR